VTAVPEIATEGEVARPTILVVDDERNIRRTLDLVLRGEGYQVVQAESAERALEILEGGQPHVDLAILDIMLPGMSGIELLERLRDDEATRELPAIVISGHASLDDATHAVELGAADFFEKPVNRERVLVSVRNALRASHLTREVAALSAEVLGRHEMIGQSPVMKRLFAEIERVAPTRASVLITGETGTGKELVSRALHRLSARAEGPFIKVNCAAIPRELIENELFGHERGAFTGADGRRRGLFEAAHRGTLFLDEIGDMDSAAQAKLLRVLELGEIVRVGGERPVSVDVRVLAATNQDLEAAVKARRFREDLYFRLAVYVLRSPSLAERVDDVRFLADAFLAAFCKENGLKPKAMAREVYAELARRRFPGNVRELRNAIERAAILSGDVVTPAHLPQDARQPEPSHVEDEDDEDDASEPAEALVAEPDAADDGGAPPAAPGPARPRLTLAQVRHRAERDYIVEVLASVDWNQSHTAAILGLDRSSLRKRMKLYGIVVPRESG
jgi:two-component system nitrogen regulation response regulator NtrX